MDHANLSQLAADAGGTPYRQKPCLTSRDLRKVAFADSHAHEEGRQLLAARRKSSLKYTDPTRRLSRIVKTKSRIAKEQDTTRWKFDSPDLDSAFQDAFDKNMSLNVLCALLDQGASINFEKTLPPAVDIWANDLVHVLLCYRGSKDIQKTVDASLKAAVAKLDLMAPAHVGDHHVGILSALVAVGARIHKATLETVVQCQHETILEILLRGQSIIEMADLSDFLPEAVRLNNYNILSMLLAYGADPDSNGAESVVNAIMGAKYKLAAALLANPSQHKISSPNMAKCVQVLLDHVHKSNHLKWLELMFAAGADPNSPGLTSRLREAVANGDFYLAQLLARTGTPVADQRDNALETAVTNSDKEMVQILLRESLKIPSSIANLLPLVLRSFRREDRIEIVGEFVSTGALGAGLNEALASVVEELVGRYGSQRPQDIDEQLLKILLDSSASVDWDGAVILKDAFAAQNTWLVRQLCLKSPAQTTLAAALALICDGDTPNSSIPSVEMVETVLRCYPLPDTLNKTLARIIRQAPGNVRLIAKFLDFGADVCWQQGIILQEAIVHCDIGTFTMLVQHISQLDVVDMHFYRSLISIEKAEVLLEKHYSQTTLDEALTVELKSTALRYDVLEFLLEKGASLDYKGGCGLQEVCRRQDFKALSICQHHGCDTTRGKALCSTIEQGVTRRVQISRLLLNKSCAPISVNDALLLAVSKRILVTHRSEQGRCNDNNIYDDRLELTKLLLDHKADVNYGQGAALKAATADAAWRLLEELMKHHPSALIVDNVFTYARSILETDESRYTAYKLLLSTSSSKPVDLDNALFDAANAGSQHQELWTLLLYKGASVDHGHGAAILATINQRNFGFLPMLLKQKPSVGILNKSLASVLKNDAKTRFQPAKMMIEAGASGEILDHAINTAVHEQDEPLMELVLEHHKKLGPKAAYALNSAATSGKIEQLHSLLACVSDRAIVTNAFETIVDQHTVENVPTGVQCASLLLDKGVERRAVTTALKSYTETCGLTEPDCTYVAKLLQHGADVAAFNGRSLHAALEFHHRDTLLQLARHATSETLTQVMPQLFSLEMPEEDVIEILETLFKQKTRPSLREASSGNPLTYLSLYHYPDSHRILQTLLRCGYSLDWERTVAVDSDTGEERGNVLMWALVGDRSDKITIQVVRTLLEAQVDVNYATRRSHVTPLMIAASNGQVSLVDLLMEHNPDVDSVDHHRRTAQSYASENGHLEIVQRLTERGSRENDGSLHEAARELHYPIIQYLINHEHDLDDPSILHEGRSALLELLLKTHLLTEAKRSALDKSLKVLLDAGADPTLVCRSNSDKNALYCALDNDHPFEILAAFLTTGQWKCLDERYNWYTDSSGRCYSATMYLERGPWKGKPADRARLMELLRMKRCKDRYFVWEGEQPADAVNPPEELAEKQRQRRAILDQQNFQLSLARREHSQQMELSKASHALSLQQERQRNETQRQMFDLQHQQRTRHQADVDTQRQNTLQLENDMAYAQQKRLGDVRMLEADHTERKELELMNRRKEIDGWRMDRADESDKKRHGLVMQQIDAQKRLVSAGYPTSPLAIMGRSHSVYSSSDVPD